MNSILNIAKKLNSPFVLLYALLGLAFFTRVSNLNYNVPFNDEAIYIVVGKMGIFEWDWSTYNSSSWMGGLPYIYPPLAAISYVTNGIVGARFLSVVFGLLTIEAIFMLTYFLTPLSKKGKILAGVFAAGLVAADPVSHYVSRLATYDIPSFYFLFLSLSLLVAGQKYKKISAPLYFSAAIAWILSFSIKIISGIYLPLILFIFFISTKKINYQNHETWKKYFLFPVLSFIFLFLIFQFSDLKTFFNTSNGREKASYLEVLYTFIEHTKLLWPFWFFSILGYISSKKWHLFLTLNVAAISILAFHIVTSRIPSFDKHVFISIGFYSVSIGIGMSLLFEKLPNSKFFKPFLIGSFLGCIGILWLATMTELPYYNSLWRNSSSIDSYLIQKVNKDDVILTELGASTMLSVYDKVSPTHVTTFDWLSYQGLEGEKAYAQAVSDGFFSYIVLESQTAPKSEVNKGLNTIIQENMQRQYKLAFEKEDFYVYKRNY